jgi:prolipoprotein diacylglyceryltransferase
MERVFNLAFLTSLVALFSSRLFFAIFNGNPQFFKPLIFFAFPYFPGFSLVGGLLGGSLFIYIFSTLRKLPAGKMFDLLIMSFASVLPLGFLLTFMLLLGKTTTFFNILLVSSLLVFLAFAKIIFPFSSRGEVRDGSVGLIFLAVFSLLYFLVKMFLNIDTFSLFEFENLVLLVSLFSSLVLLINQEIMNKFLSKNE